MSRSDHCEIHPHVNGKQDAIRQSMDLEESVRQIEQKFSTDYRLRTIVDETTNDEKKLITLVCLERRNLEQIQDEYKDHKKNLSTRFGVAVYEDTSVVPKDLRKTVIMLSHDESRSSTFMVAKIDQGYTSQVQRMHLLQNDRQGHQD